VVRGQKPPQDSGVLLAGLVVRDVLFVNVAAHSVDPPARRFRPLTTMKRIRPAAIVRVRAPVTLIELNVSFLPLGSTVKQKRATLLIVGRSSRWRPPSGRA